MKKDLGLFHVSGANLKKKEKMYLDVYNAYLDEDIAYSAREAPDGFLGYAHRKGGDPRKQPEILLARTEYKEPLPTAEGAIKKIKKEVRAVVAIIRRCMAVRLEK
jgi:hypothetical protein